MAVLTSRTFNAIEKTLHYKFDIPQPVEVETYAEPQPDKTKTPVGAICYLNDVGGKPMFCAFDSDLNMAMAKLGREIDEWLMALKFDKDKCQACDEVFVKRLTEFAKHATPIK
jgi:hypothetical protein